jgi:signal transduction histidine kinase/ligand-binding sensor domain-containing protein/CheY-like chemotaxis protein
MFNNNYRFSVFLCIVFILSSLTLDILPQSKDVNSNWLEPVFEHLTIADGLPENSVRCILQDHLGYMWFGTQNGLVKYDGYGMKVYQPDPDDSLSINDRQIWAIYEDKSGTLWIGTEHEGLNRFNRATETFTRYILNPDDSSRENEIKSICEDSTGKLLVGNGDKLIIFNPQDKSSKNIYTKDSIISKGVSALIKDRLTGEIFVAVKDKIMIYDPKKKMLIKDNKIGPKLELDTIHSFYQSADGTIWIGHSRGIARFNSVHNTIKYYQPVQSIKYKIENDIGQLVEDENGFIWGCNPVNRNIRGFVCFDPKNEQFKIYKSDRDKKKSLSADIIWSVYKDHSGILWVGTGWGGLNKWNGNKYKFKRFINDSNGKNFKRVDAIIEDEQGIIWLGTENGFYSFNRHSNELRNFRFATKSEDNWVVDMYQDESGVIWLSTGILGRFDREKRTFRFFSNSLNDPLSLKLDQSTYILPEGNQFLWIGTWGNGLYRFDKKTGDLTWFRHDPDNPRSLSSDEIECLYNDKRGNFWIGTNNGGLCLFDRTDKSFKSFKIEEDRTTTITAIYEDHKKNFWIGTYQTGLYLFDRDNGKPVYNITVKDGLANNVVRSILEDDSGNLWISTEYGLSKFNPETRQIRNYYTSDILEENRYVIHSACKTSTGEMLFGSSDGFIMFHPDSIKDDPVPPQVVISNVSLFNRPGEKLKIDGFISEKKELNLSYDENDLRFDYVGLHYADPLKNRYKYKLEGFDKDWVDAGTQRNATYTNLGAGEYTFKVTACNEDGVWNEKDASIKIIIPPPFWATWWAYGFYLIFFVSIMYGIRKYEMNRLNWKNQSKLDEVKLKEREETDKMKSRFFANISHEFRTPLTLILGPAEKLISKFRDEEIQKQTGVIKRNANRLLNLINQLLDLSKLETGKFELKASEGNIVTLIKGLTMSFESIAERKNISLSIKSESDEIKVFFNKEMMIKVMTNLLSNAFKFTSEGGQITVFINVIDNNSVEIKVKDTGIGIPEEELPKLFDRFYQVDSSQTREYEGTGLGLALTKELVELHRGKIKVKSTLGKGSVFIIELPLGRNHLKDEEVVEIDEAEKPGILIENDEYVPSATEAIEREEIFEKEKNVILIVEDNREVRGFIRDSLEDVFEIQEASNGEEGFRMAEKSIPDLIISDIMMPKMDGNELTKKIKNDEKTSHIPVILLTAKSEQESKLEGLKTGADDYLIKPFDSKELRIRIRNLIDIRRKLQEKYSKGDYSWKQDKEKLSSLDEQFMSKVMEVIENHISEEDFSIENFDKEMGMGRVQNYRKLKALTGCSPSRYIRRVRLIKAREMLKDKQGNVSEIAYSVGFSSPAYFTKCFKEEFGYSPSELKN